MTHIPVDVPSERDSAASSPATTETDLPDHFLDPDDSSVEADQRRGLGTLTLGAIGVVYGDIGTSPLYAFREALRPVAENGVVDASAVLGLLSLLLWALILIVTAKYVLFLLRLDNRGEGGILALYTLVRLAIGRRSLPVLALGIFGAALFFGDAIITPAISVLSAVEGAGLVVPALAHLAVPVALGILAGLFLMQGSGTGAVAGAFGPITAIWFMTLGGLGLHWVVVEPTVLHAFNPVLGLAFLTDHPGLALAVLGAVFLAVTGAEALYADLGHFGRRPILLAWFALVFPALTLNYLGQGAAVLHRPSAVSNPLFAMVSPAALPWFVALATAATVIAAQAVISGAFSLGRAAVQLGLLPRLQIRHTSAHQSGQIYIPTINWWLLICVALVVVFFGTSEAMASAYGIAVTSTMLVTSVLACLYLIRSGVLPMPLAVAAILPIAMIEGVFLAANLSKFTGGGYVPALAALGLFLLMVAWWRGSQAILARARRQLVSLDSFVRSMEKSSVHVVPGTGFFLGPDPDAVPPVLLHNLKHNRVRHEQTVVLAIETLRIPVADAADRVSVETLAPGFRRLILRFGFMETPNVSRALGEARRAGLRFDVMQTTFFLGRRHPVVTSPAGLRGLLDRLYALLYKMSADPSEFYHLPRDRVVELGQRVAV